MNGYIYLIYANGKTKIGKTRNLKKRMGGYRTHNPDAELHSYVQVSDLDASETKLIAALREKGYLTVDNAREWFEGEVPNLEFLEILTEPYDPVNYWHQLRRGGISYSAGMPGHNLQAKIPTNPDESSIHSEVLSFQDAYRLSKILWNTKVFLFYLGYRHGEMGDEEWHAMFPQTVDDMHGWRCPNHPNHKYIGCCFPVHLINPRAFPGTSAEARFVFSVKESTCTLPCFCDSGKRLNQCCLNYTLWGETMSREETHWALRKNGWSPIWTALDHTDHSFDDNPGDPPLVVTVREIIPLGFLGHPSVFVRLTARDIRFKSKKKVALIKELLREHGPCPDEIRTIDSYQPAQLAWDLLDRNQKGEDILLTRIHKSTDDWTQVPTRNRK